MPTHNKTQSFPKEQYPNNTNTTRNKKYSSFVQPLLTIADFNYNQDYRYN